MTTDEILDYYAKLLILQYRGQPKAFETIRAWVKGAVMDQLPTDVENGFDPATAVGAQLDVLAKYQGITRSTTYSGGTIELGDNDFRQMFLFAIARNQSDGTLAGIGDLLQQFFGLEVLVFDYQNMRMSYLIDSAVGSTNLFISIVVQGLLPKPMGVQLASVIVIPVIIGCFGYRTYEAANPIVNGYNTYTAYETDWPFIDYQDAIVV